jgi:GDP-mannose 6-dehydrogenase
MRISIVGIGYVGAVAAACLAKDGHTVIGVDISKEKVDAINAGLAPLIEPGLEELIGAGVASGRLRATTDLTEALAQTELSILCVGTPSLPNGNIDLSHVVNVCKELGAGLAQKNARHTFVVRSTMLPGSIMNSVVPELERHSGKTAGTDFGIALFPEFLREGTAISDYDNPSLVVIGGMDEESIKLLLKLNERYDAPKFVTDVRTAELVKYTCNVWHALKVSFGNEIGTISKALGLDGQKVMEIVCGDRRLNISAAYLKPGFAFGGSCLPKDLRALRYLADDRHVASPILDAIVAVNENQVSRAMDMVKKTGKRKVGMLGLSFKADTDDLRESPLVEIAERLLGKGYDLKIFDHNINTSRLTGKNRQYVMAHLPHLSNLLSESLDSVIDHADTVIIGNSDKAFRTVGERLRPDQAIIDLIRVDPSLAVRPQYDGICW